MYIVGEWPLPRVMIIFISFGELITSIRSVNVRMVYPSVVLVEVVGDFHHVYNLRHRQAPGRKSSERYGVVLSGESTPQARD